MKTSGMNCGNWHTAIEFCAYGVKFAAFFQHMALCAHWGAIPLKQKESAIDAPSRSMTARLNGALPELAGCDPVMLFERLMKRAQRIIAADLVDRLNGHVPR